MCSRILWREMRVPQGGCLLVWGRGQRATMLNLAACWYHVLDEYARQDVGGLSLKASWEVPQHPLLSAT